MHTEDKLTQQQRIRLEALNQAVIRATHSPLSHNDETILRTAEKFSSFIMSGKSGSRRDN